MLKNTCLVVLCLMTLSLLSCGDPYSPGISDWCSGKLRNMRPRAFIATTAMHALLQNNPNMEDGALAQRAFEIADAMITEGEKPRETTD